MPNHSRKNCSHCGGQVEFRHIRGHAVPIHQGTNGCHVALKKGLSKKPGERGIRIRDLLYRRRMVPFVHKGWCEREVWFYEDELGSKVWFDSPTPPWPKHECRPASDHTSKVMGEKAPQEQMWIPVVLYYEHFHFQKGIRQIQIRDTSSDQSYGIFNVIQLDDWRRVILKENWKAAWLAEQEQLRAISGPVKIFCPKRRVFNDEERIDYMEIGIEKDPQQRFSF